MTINYTRMARALTGIRRCTCAENRCLLCRAADVLRILREEMEKARDV